MSDESGVILRPGVINSGLWYPKRPPEEEWLRIRLIAMERENWTCVCCRHRARKWMNAHHITDSGDHTPENLAPVCVACHAVLHIGLNLMKKVIEIWNCDLGQVEIVRQTRAGIRQGRTLREIKGSLPLTRGKYPPDSVNYANDLIRTMGNAPRASLDEPLCAVFVERIYWQLED